MSEELSQGQVDFLAQLSGAVKDALRAKEELDRDREHRQNQRIEALDRGVSGVLTAFDRMESEIAQLRTGFDRNTFRVNSVAAAMVTLSAAVSSLREGVASQITHEVQKALDVQRPIADLSAGRAAAAGEKR